MSLRANIQDIKGYIADYKCNLNDHDNCEQANATFSTTPTLVSTLFDRAYKALIQRKFGN